MKALEKLEALSFYHTGDDKEYVGYEHAKEAVKEAYNQALKDAADNARVIKEDPWSCGSCSIDVNSILKLKK